MLLGDNTGGGPVVLQPDRFQCVQVRISGRFPFLYRVVSHIYIVILCLRLIFRNVSVAQFGRGEGGQYEGKLNGWKTL